jgi:adenylate kinase
MAKGTSKKKATAEAIVITGSVGTGKSHVAAELARILSLRHVDVGKIVLENRKTLSAGIDKKRKVLIADLAKVKKLLSRKRMLGKGNIVEGHYSHEIVDKGRVFVLRCNPEELDKRLSARGYSEDKRAENILSEILDSCTIEAEMKFGRGKVVEIETSGRTSGDVAGEIAKIILGSRKAPRPRVDFSKYLGPRFL